MPSENVSPQMFQTTLAERPLPEILMTVHRYRAPGVIHCDNGLEKKTVYVEAGHITFAHSNQPDDRLGKRLLTGGLISAQEHEEGVRRLSTTGKRIGTILTEMRVIEPRDLFVTLQSQIQEIVWSVFAWDQGSAVFTPGADKGHEYVKIKLPIPQTIMLGVRKIPDVKPLANRLGSRTAIYKRTAKPIDGLDLSDDELRVLDHVNGKRPLFELAHLPPLTPGDNARVLYGLSALELITINTPLKVQVKTRSRMVGSA